MNKYQTLAGNAVKLGLGTFGSKILVFLMVRFYTEYLLPTDYGTADLITQTANLLIPLVSLGITDAVFRFAMDGAAGGERGAPAILRLGLADVHRGHGAQRVGRDRVFAAGGAAAGGGGIFCRVAVRAGFMPGDGVCELFDISQQRVRCVKAERAVILDGAAWRGEQRGAQSAAHPAHRRVGRGLRRLRLPGWRSSCC